MFRKISKIIWDVFTLYAFAIAFKECLIIARDFARFITPSNKKILNR